MTDHKIDIPDWMWKKAQEAYAVENPASKMRDIIAERLVSPQLPVEATATATEPNEDHPYLNDGIHRPLQMLAQKMLKAGFDGQLMRDPAEAMQWIRAMANGDLDEHDMPAGGHLFWKAARTKFAVWRA